MEALTRMEKTVSRAEGKLVSVAAARGGRELCVGEGSSSTEGTQWALAQWLWRTEKPLAAFVRGEE